MATATTSQTPPGKDPGSQTITAGPPATGDSVTGANGGQITIEVALKLTGSYANVQADWATLLGTSWASQSAQLSHEGG